MFTRDVTLDGFKVMEDGIAVFKGGLVMFAEVEMVVKDDTKVFVLRS